MPTPPARSLLSLALILGLLPACAHGERARKGEAATAPESLAPASTVTSSDLRRHPGEPIERVLAARVPGAWITRTADGGIAVLIRGATSIHGSNAPLYILDGVAIQPGPGGSLTGVNPYDIDSIEVLKDATSTSMYGVRGANGVIVIKTKRPGQ
jgi:TonB-dependent SusC/RagA subfamily outer membrane receptor